MYGRNTTMRKNRVAGPGFHCNVRYDQFTIAQMRGRGGMKTVNPLLPASTHAEIYDVKEQELLVAERASGSMYHDGYTHCYSALNGYDIPGNITSAQAVKDYILNRVKFVGVAVTEQRSDDKLIDQGLVAQVGGVVTILNNGEKPIMPCDKVALDINFSVGRRSITREKGIPREKVRFCVRPADDDQTIIDTCLNLCSTKDSDVDITPLIQAVKAAKAAAEAEPDNAEMKQAYKKAVTAYKEAKSKKRQCKLEVNSGEDLREFLNLYRHANELVIGKALSYAAVGDRFELLLQPRSTI